MNGSPLSSRVPRRPVTALAMRPARLAEQLFAGAWEDLVLLAEVELPVLQSFDEPHDGPDLAEVEVLITGWGCPQLSPDVLARMPRLRAVFHTGGATEGIISSRAAQQKGILVASAAEANAIPVAEYAFAEIILANKRIRASEQVYRRRRELIDREVEFSDTGNYRRTVGLVGASRTGRRVAELLRGTDLTVLVHDPYLPPPEAAALGVRLCDLHDLMRLSDVVSLHVPVTPETTGMIDRHCLSLMRAGSTLINTARGAVVDQDALVDEVRSGRINAVLDVTEPEPLPADHPLWELPNVTLTPHVAGSTGTELTRLGRAALKELAHYASTASAPRAGGERAATSPSASAVSSAAPGGNDV